MYGHGETIYILTNKGRTVLHTGVTSDLSTRLREHLEKNYPESFTSRYNCTLLIYYKSYSSIEEAIEEEKRLKS